jgi:hypothetical protein
LISRHATGQTGEAIIGAELARLGFTIAYPSGNAPNIDILAYRNGESRAVQVKAVSKGSLQINLGKFLQIDFAGDPEIERQIVSGPLASLDPTIDFVIVFLGEALGQDEVYCTKLGDFVRFAMQRHLDYLGESGVRRGSNKRSLHSAFDRKVIALSSVFKGFHDHFR